MRYALLVARVSLPLWISLFGSARPATAQGLDARMQTVVAKFVEQTGEQVMTVGSWVKGNFNQATSDFDMRLVVPAADGAKTAPQLSRWKKSRQVLASLIKEEFGPGQSGNILSRTNLYAPSALMEGVENTTEAVERFQQYRTVPNLGYNGPVNANTPVGFTEGLYGPGSQTYVQGYEKSAGRLYYLRDGKVYSGLSEMARVTEGVGEAAYTAAGTANTAGQWAEHGLAEVGKGRGDKVAKYLERLERDLTKSRSLSKLPLDQGLRTELQELRALLKKDPKKLANVSERVAQALSRGRTEAALLKSMGEAGPIRRMYLRIMLDGVAAGNKVGELMSKLMKQVPSWANTENAIHALVWYLGVKASASALGEGDALDAIAASCAEFKWLTAFGPLLLGQIYTEIMIQARLGGYEMAAGLQSAWDLMEGIYSAWGRVSVDPDPRRRLSLADLVAKFHYEDKLKAIVYSQAVRASTRDLGAANAQADAGVAEAIFAKCWPVIRDAWRWERDGLASEYLKLGSAVVHTPLVISYLPYPAQVKTRIVCDATSFDRKLSERLARMSQIIVLLYGKGSGVASTYYWSEGGVDVGDRDWQRGYTFAAPGTYPVKVTLAIQPFTRNAATEPRVMRRREVQALVDVVVTGPPQPVKGILECHVQLNGTQTLKGKTPAEDRTINTLADTSQLKAPVTVSGRRFEASGVERVPSNSPAVYDLTTRWTVRGTLSEDRTVCTELALDYEQIGTSTIRNMTVKFTAAIVNVPLAPNTTVWWETAEPNVQAVTFSRTYSDLDSGTPPPFTYSGKGEVRLGLYGQGLSDQR